MTIGWKVNVPEQRKEFLLYPLARPFELAIVTLV